MFHSSPFWGRVILMKEYKLEITYEIRENPKESWIYVKIEAKSFEEALQKAKKSFDAWARSVGWVKMVTVKKIAPLRKTDDKPIRKRNNQLSDARPFGSAKPKPRTRKSRSNRTDTKKPTGANSRTKPNAPSTSKPKTNRKASGTTTRRSKPKPTTTSSGSTTRKKRPNNGGSSPRSSRNRTK